MKVFVIGGKLPAIDDPLGTETWPSIASAARTLGASLAKAKFDLVNCSPYPGSADLEVQTGFATEWSGHAPRNSAEIHFPELHDIEAAVDETNKRLDLDRAIQKFRYPPIFKADGGLERRLSWLICQMAALERCDVVVAIGGDPSGTSNLLLFQADARRKPMLPLPYFGGAAQAAFSRRQFQLADRLGASHSEKLRGQEAADDVGVLLSALLTDPPNDRASAGKARFFISYPRARPAEADFVEMSLRRRNQDVFRDDHNLDPGGHLPTAIRDEVYAASVFIALWCQEYACSPWCHDELEMALDRARDDRLRIVIISVDDTRIVPMRARELINYKATSRTEIEGILLKLV